MPVSLTGKIIPLNAGFVGMVDCNQVLDTSITAGNILISNGATFISTSAGTDSFTQYIKHQGSSSIAITIPVWQDTGQRILTTTAVYIEDGITIRTTTGGVYAAVLGVLESGATPTKYTYFQGGDQTIDLTYTLPVSYPTVSGYVMACTDAGVMSWVANGSGGGYTNLTQFVDQTAWRSFYSNNLGDVVELAFGTIGKVLTSGGASAAPTWETPTVYQTLDADLTAIAALGFTATAFLKKTAADTWALDTSTYLTAEADTLATVMARGATTALQLTSTLAIGTSPFAITSTTVNTNLNADLLDGNHASAFATTGTTITIAGTANQITSSAGAQDLSTNRTWTLSLPADVLIPTVLTVPNTGLHLLDTNASHDLIIKPGSDLTADKTLTITTGDTDMIVNFTAVTDEYVLAYDVTSNTWRGVVASGGGYTNLTQFVAQTAWQMFYSNNLGDVTELAFGTTGKVLTSNGATSAPTWETPSAGGGSPGSPDNSIQYRVNSTTFGGITGITTDGTNLILATTQTIRFRDATNYIQSNVADNLTLVAQTSMNFYIGGLTGRVLGLTSAGILIGGASADPNTDYTITVDSNPNNGIITWMTDEDYFAYSDDILMNDTQRIYFGSTNCFVYSESANQVTLAGSSKTTIGVAGDIILGDGTLRYMYPVSDAKMQLGYLNQLGFNNLYLSGNAAQEVAMNLHLTSNTAGNDLYLRAGGATNGATNKAGGTLVLRSGISTGSGISSMNFDIFLGIAASTTANSAVTAMTIAGTTTSATASITIGKATTHKIGFYNSTAVVQATACTTALTTITHTAPGTPDYAIQNFAQNGGTGIWGFATQDEANTLLKVVAHLQAVVGELRAKLGATSGVGLIAGA